MRIRGNLFASGELSKRSTPGPESRASLVTPPPRRSSTCSPRCRTCLRRLSVSTALLLRRCEGERRASIAATWRRGLEAPYPRLREAAQRGLAPRGGNSWPDADPRQRSEPCEPCDLQDDPLSLEGPAGVPSPSGRPPIPEGRYPSGSQRRSRLTGVTESWNCPGDS